MKKRQLFKRTQRIIPLFALKSELNSFEKNQTADKFQKDIDISYSKNYELKLVSVGLASPETIRRWAEKKLPNGKILGQVTTANTLHHKTFKPQKGGLFCERIFGPLKDFECACGKKVQKPAPNQEYNENQRKFCPNCDVEYTWSVIRRYQLGYIQLTSPVSHIWYLKANPSYLSILLDMKRKTLESIIYCTATMTLENGWKANQIFNSFAFQLPLSNFLNGDSFSIHPSPSSLLSSWKKNLKEDKNLELLNKSEIQVFGESTTNGILKLKKPLKKTLTKRFKVLPKRLTGWRSKIDQMEFSLNLVNSKSVNISSSIENIGTGLSLVKENKKINYAAVENIHKMPHFFNKKFFDSIEKKLNSNKFMENKNIEWSDISQGVPNYISLKLEWIFQKQILFLVSKKALKFFYKMSSINAVQKVQKIFKNTNIKAISKDLNSPNQISNFFITDNLKLYPLNSKPRAKKEKKLVHLAKYYFHEVISHSLNTLPKFKLNLFKKNKITRQLSFNQWIGLVTNQTVKNIVYKTKPLNQLLSSELSLLFITNNNKTDYFQIKELYDFENFSFLKNSILLKKRFLLKKKIHPKNLDQFFKNYAIYNNIYSVSHRYCWTIERNWQYFLFFNSSPINLMDHPIAYYKNRIVKINEFTEDNSLAGASIIQKLLAEFNISELKKMDKQNRILLYELNKKITKYKILVKRGFAARSERKKLKELYEKRDLLIRRTKITRKLARKKENPESMILSVLPVLPPDLRPILKMQDQIAASDLNRLYQRVIYRNDRLKKFLKDPATRNSFEMKYSQRLLQEAVDNLIQNGKGGITPERDSRGRSLKSLSEVLKGKQGRFRQYLLGKRVDYSGRSVIVVGPKLKLHECGLPKEMALELFLPFVIKRMLHYKFARTVIGAKTLIKSNQSLTWEILREVMQNSPVLLNRAPTLHRLGIQAFQPKLIEGKAILLHPLVCPAFNADFDGDQMAVHVPITTEARAEAWKLIFSRNNLISPATAEPIVLPSQDMVLGCYYLTTESFKLEKGEGLCFSSMNEVLKALEKNKVKLHTLIWLKVISSVQMGFENSEPLEIRVDSLGYWTEIQSKNIIRFDSNGSFISKIIRTTPGRVLMNAMIQKCIQISS